MIAEDSPDNSPDFLGKPPKNSGGRRLNRVPIIICGVMLGIMLILVLYVMQTREQGTQSASNAVSEQATPEPSTPDVALDKDSLKFARGPSQTTVTSSASMTTSPGVTQGQVVNTQEDLASLQAQQQFEAALAAKRQQALLQALDAPTEVDTESSNTVTTNTNTVSTQPSSDASANSDNTQTPATGPDPNKQAQKQAWLNQTPKTQDYLSDTRTPPISPYELKAGSVIPAVMISGINSDLPGQIIAQVRENVYDSATGQYLLLPQGSRLVGTYDNGITMGQSRVLAAWTRVIYPDGSSLDLGLMPGQDAGGYAGFNDKTNNHYARIFGSALMLSMFSAGIQLSQPQNNNGDNYSSSQIIAASLGQQLGDLGMEVTRRNLDIAPTLEIRPGYLFNVMITKDIILKPWQGS
jgi:type IV secretion system protein VirB10